MWSGERAGEYMRDDDCDALWAHFEACAQTVTKLYREPNWRSLQTAAAATTQLYKSGLECHKKGFDRGYQAGRQMFAKEVLACFGGKVDGTTLLAMISTKNGEERVEGETPPAPADHGALQIFQQALVPNPNAPDMADLKEFFSSQLQRHRKRPRSPPSPTAYLKRLRRNS